MTGYEAGCAVACLCIMPNNPSFEYIDLVLFFFFFGFSVLN